MKQFFLNLRLFVAALVVRIVLWWRDFRVKLDKWMAEP
jgi:hypothetical protein